MPKPATLGTDSASPSTAREIAGGPPIPKDEAARVEEALGDLLSVCRDAGDSKLAEEQPIGTFRVEET